MNLNDYFNYAKKLADYSEDGILVGVAALERLQRLLMEREIHELEMNKRKLPNPIQTQTKGNPLSISSFIECYKDEIILNTEKRIKGIFDPSLVEKINDNKLYQNDAINLLYFTIELYCLAKKKKNDSITEVVRNLTIDLLGKSLDKGNTQRNYKILNLVLNELQELKVLIKSQEDFANYKNDVLIDFFTNTVPKIPSMTPTKHDLSSEVGSNMIQVMYKSFQAITSVEKFKKEWVNFGKSIIENSFLITPNSPKFFEKHPIPCYVDEYLYCLREIAIDKQLFWRCLQHCCKVYSVKISLEQFNKNYLNGKVKYSSDLEYSCFYRGMSEDTRKDVLEYLNSNYVYIPLEVDMDSVHFSVEGLDNYASEIVKYYKGWENLVSKG